MTDHYLGIATSKSFTDNLTRWLNDGPQVPGGAPLCQCASVADVLDAEFAGSARPLCPKHDANAIRARDAAEARAKYDAETARIQRVRDEMRIEDQERTAAKARAERAAAEAEQLAKLDPLVRHLTVLSGADPLASTPTTDEDITIGADGALMHVLNTALGITSSEHPDQPLDAA